MAKSYSSEFQATVNATSATESPLLLLEINHPQLSTPVRVVNDKQDLVSNGDTYTALAFRGRFPGDTESGQPRAQLAIDNVGKDLVQWLEASAGGKGATVRIMQVMRSAPDNIEHAVTLDLSNTQVTPVEVSGTLGYEDLLNRTAVPYTYSPKHSPGLY